MQSSSDDLKFKVELFISCKKLPKSDTFAKIYMKTQNEFEKIFETETIKNDSDPKFTKSCIIEYYFEILQNLKIEICGTNGKCIGSFDTLLGNIVSARGQCVTGELKNEKGKACGTISIQLEQVAMQYNEKGDQFKEVIDNLEKQPILEIKKNISQLIPKMETVEDPNLTNINFNCSAKNLDKKDFFGKSDPYFIMFRTMEGSEPIKVYTSEIVKKTLNPTWRAFTIPEQKLCNFDRKRPIKIEVWDWDRFSSHDFIGEFTLSLEDILDGTKEYEIINSKYSKKSSYKNSGIFSITASCEIPRINKENELYKYALSCLNRTIKKRFMDYIAGGCEIQVTVGIDFTSSNGANTQKPSSLHYQGSTNPYIEAIESVVSILQPYCLNKNIPIFGYGAEIDGKVPPFFPVSLECFGVEDIISKYKSIVPTIKLSCMSRCLKKDGKESYHGDDFYPLIEHSLSLIGNVSQHQQTYSVLLLIIDGDIFDVQPTIDTIIKAGQYPVSIIIVGVGNGGFSNSKKFDADEEPLVHSDGTKMTRDIVQFVRFNDFKGDMKGLAAAVLEELPTQLVEYMESKGITPNPRLSAY